MREGRPCPRTGCGKDMLLIHIAETEFEKINQNHPWTYVFYFCKSCNRSLMVTRTTEVIYDKEGRI